MQTLKLGFIGAGFVANFHATALKMVRGIELSGVYSLKGAELKGIICEKPLGRTVTEAKRLVTLAKEANLRTAYFENQIHMKAIKNALAQLEPQRKTMGPVVLARSAEEHAGPHEPWFWDPTRQGGGVLSDMGCHSIAVSWFVLTPVGKPPTFLKPVSVNTETALLKWGQPQSKTLPV